MQLIRDHLNELKEICDQHHVEKLYVFGSYVAERQHDLSDVDLLVTFKKEEIELLDFADNYFSMLESLEGTLERKVDLVTSSSLKNPVLIQSIDQTKLLIYESDSSEISA